MKKILIGAAFALSLISCSTQKKLYQQSGFFIKTQNGYEFVPMSDWTAYTPGNNPCDSIRQFVLTNKKPK